MQLAMLLQNVVYAVLCGSLDLDVRDIIYDSKKVFSGTLFVCLKGQNADGHDYIADAIAKGAVAIVIEKDYKGSLAALASLQKRPTIIQVENTSDALGEMSRAFFDFPEKELTLIGLTGTKGKTTVTAMLAKILNGAGIKAGTIGTLGVCINQQTIPLQNTTPESYLIQKYLRMMADDGCQVVVMEVSSQALMCGRVRGMVFDCGVITNIYPDHIGPGEHKDFDEYKYWKGQMLVQCRHCIVNEDDALVMEQVLKRNATVETFSQSEYENQQWKLNLLGHFNEMNALAAAKVARHLGVCEEDIRDGLENVKIFGRCEIVARHNGGLFVIDYAHNGQALEMVLKALRKYATGRLICVFGCGGNRAKIRRESMAQAASMYADEIIITSDNPRYEEPMAIIHDIENEILKTNAPYQVIENRKMAIEVAYDGMRLGDVVLLAGKGHEMYQEVKGEKIPFDERQIIGDLQENLRLSYDCKQGV